MRVFYVKANTELLTTFHPFCEGNRELFVFSDGQNINFQTEAPFSSVESEVQSAFQYFLDEVKQDAILYNNKRNIEESTA